MDLSPKQQSVPKHPEDTKITMMQLSICDFFVVENLRKGYFLNGRPRIGWIGNTLECPYISFLPLC